MITLFIVMIIYTYIARKTLNLLMVNCCSLRSSTKRLQLAALIKKHDIDVVTGCESHLDTSYFTSEVFTTNYVAYRKEKYRWWRYICSYKRRPNVITRTYSAELVWTKLFIVGMKRYIFLLQTTQFRPGTSCRAKEFLKLLV